jgi:hypothetical protein
VARKGARDRRGDRVGNLERLLPAGAAEHIVVREPLDARCLADGDRAVEPGVDRQGTVAGYQRPR